MKMYKYNIDVMLDAETDEDKKFELDGLFNIEDKSEIIEINTLNNTHGNANITIKATPRFMESNYDEDYGEFAI